MSKTSTASSTDNGSGTVHLDDLLDVQPEATHTATNTHTETTSTQITLDELVGLTNSHATGSSQVATLSVDHATLKSEPEYFNRPLLSIIGLIAVLGAVAWLVVRRRAQISAILRRVLFPSALPRVVATAMLLLAPGDWSADFYSLLRWVVFGAAVLPLIMAYHQHRYSWAWLAGMVAVLFNPFVFIRLSRDSWHLIDYAAALFFLVSLTVRESTSSAFSDK